MNTSNIKSEVEKNITKLAGLRDEVKVRLHLASLDAKQEWDDKIAPHVLDAETAAKNLAEAMELQADYWKKQLGTFQSQAEEMRTLSSKVTADAAAPIRARMSRGLD